MCPFVILVRAKCTLYSRFLRLGVTLFTRLFVEHLPDHVCFLGHTGPLSTLAMQGLLERHDRGPILQFKDGHHFAHPCQPVGIRITDDRHIRRKGPDTDGGLHWAAYSVIPPPRRPRGQEARAQALP